MPATVLEQTGPVSYTVRTRDDIVWRRHTDQLLAGSTVPVETPSVIGTEPFKQNSPAQPTLTQDAPCAMDPVSSGPTSTAVSETELSPCPTPRSVPVTVSVDPPDGGVIRRYPQRERWPPKRLDL